MVGNMEELTMGCCGVTVWYPVNFLKDKRETKDTFYCPNGHARSYRTSELERLQKEMDQIRADRDDKQAKLEKLKLGRCPFCWKTVKNLSGHISRKHK